jgi:hypothetical protein
MDSNTKEEPIVYSINALKNEVIFSTLIQKPM